MVMCMKINCTQTYKIAAESDIQDFQSHLLCNTTDMLWTERTSDVRYAEKRFIHNELQSLAGGHGGQSSSTF